ncbi:MAG: beta-N-acetylhexosaminidase, partial [Nitrospinales bacterium]
GRNFVSIPQLHRLIRDVQRLASTRGSGIPLFISVDQEGGRVSRLKSPFSEFPSQSCLGKAQSEDLAFRFGQALAWELKAVGINMDFAPVLDVNTNPANPIIGNRALSDDPHWTARLGGAVVRGIRETGVLPVGKHFPGHGDTREDSHLELPRVQKDAAALDQTELLPFAHAIQEGLEAVMTAHVVYPAWDAEYPASFSKTILQDILRTKLNFQGLVISDDLEMKAVENHFPLESIPALGLDAGLDLFLICNSVEKTGAV